MIKDNTRGIMKRNIFTALALALVSVSGAAASIVYDNTANDTGGTIFYSTGDYLQIGDLVKLDGVDHALTGASVQFYNNGEADGTFDAIISFWNPDAPVGGLLGSYETDGLSINGFDVATAPFTIANLSVPDTVVVSVQIVHASEGMDLGITLFDTPTVGSSDNTQFIVYSDGGFQTTQTEAGFGNLYLQLSATTLDTATTPEPSTGIMLGGIVVLLGIAKRSKRGARAPSANTGCGARSS
jgi:hypothetical protein